MLPEDVFYMARCLQLARLGLGLTAPNPMVGAVVVHNNRIIGEGWHRACGGPHAEVHAIATVREQHLLKESTLYCTMEPCNHHGKTPPCTELILASGIPRVVIGQTDPNTEVAGGGAQHLINRGVEVISGVLEDECLSLNKRFNTFHTQKRPYIILKWAQTRDGFVDAERDPASGVKPAWITNESCRRLVHKWRTEEQAILAGSRTILLDNPQLNVRAWSGRNPVRITIDRTTRITGENPEKPAGSATTGFKFLDRSVPTLVFTTAEKPLGPYLPFIRIDPDQPVWPQVLNKLYQRDIQSVLVEGGPTLLKSLIDKGLWDEARVFIGAGWFGHGVKAPELPSSPTHTKKVGNSNLLLFRNRLSRSDSHLMAPPSEIHPDDKPEAPGS